MDAVRQGAVEWDIEGESVEERKRVGKEETRRRVRKNLTTNDEWRECNSGSVLVE
jgi:hypothetical protein